MELYEVRTLDNNELLFIAPMSTLVRCLYLRKETSDRIKKETKNGFGSDLNARFASYGERQNFVIHKFTGKALMDIIEEMEHEE